VDLAGVCGFDHQGATGIAGAELDALAGEDQGAAAADAALNARWFGSWRRRRPGRAGVADPDSAAVSGFGRLRNRVPSMVICMRPRSSRTVTRRPAMEADRMLATGERKQTCGVHKPVRLDRDARAAG
jgi:hypothetical protein